MDLVIFIFLNIGNQNNYFKNQYESIQKRIKKKFSNVKYNNY